MKIKFIIASVLMLMLFLTPAFEIHASKNVSRLHRKQRLERLRKSPSKSKSKSKAKRKRAALPAAAGIYVQTLAGDTLLDQRSTEFFNPASVMKIATSHAALTKLGFDYRFTTTLYTNGYLDKDGVLAGDLILTGSSDPGFFTENVFLVMEHLNQIGITEVTGDLVIVPPFYLNFDSSTPRSAQTFLRMISAKNWSNTIDRAWQQYKGPQSLEHPLGVSIQGQVRIAHQQSVPDANWQPLLIHRSRPLYEILKNQNDFSNNFMAEAIGRYIGGPRVIERFLIQDVGLNDEEIRVVSASGLGANRITPRAALKLMRSFYQSVTEHGRNLADLMPVAGIDEGTLEDRFTTPELRGSVIAKTGTLPSQRASALVGAAYTKDRGVILFAILNRDIIIRARHRQDELVAEILSKCGGGLPYTDNKNSETHLAGTPEVVVSYTQPHNLP